ncbi:MAG: (d)CMP kinase [Alphaproteobacteria bacterium]|nr:(d)CMP kinase [Alphaproteobacteria bacterium]
MIIAIDGPSGAGKGRLSQALCDKYGFTFLDSGLIFRATALKAHKQNIDLNDDLAIADIAISLTPEDFHPINELRSEENGQAASKIAVLKKTRASIVQYVKNFAEHNKNATPGAIIDGRDIGTAICPDAKLKLFITASQEERAKRRLKELQMRGITVIYNTVLQEMIKRDKRDSERKDSPLVAADDAIAIDTTDLNIADVVDIAVKAVNTALAQS